MASDGIDKSLVQIVMNTLSAISTDGMSYEILINLLSLLCLFCIVNRQQQTPSKTVLPSSPAPSSLPSTAAGNPLQKLLGELTKRDGENNSPPSDMLMSLLPLLNSPQVKSKINPASMGAILNLVGNLNSSVSDKPEKQEKQEAQPATCSMQTPPAPPVATISPASQPTEPLPAELEKKELGRYLNWKANFDAKEV
jgi:hypothetical protein